MTRLPPRIHIIGRKNHGKTTLVVDLVQALTEQGVRVGTIKHTHHHHQLDVPGKDSFRHRQAGAAVSAILSPDANAVFFPPAQQAAEKYACFAPQFADCQLILVEGDTAATAPRLEVWRQERGDEALAAQDSTIVAVVSDDRPSGLAEGTPVWARSDLAGLCERLLELTVESRARAERK